MDERGADTKDAPKLPGQPMTAASGGDRRPRAHGRSGLIGVLVVFALLGLGAATTATALRPVRTATCSVGATGPIIKYPKVYAVGFFCSPENRTDKATVILQGHIGGKWKALATVTKHLTMSRDKKYTLKTPPIHCTAHAHYVYMRGYASLAAGPPNGTIRVHNDGERTDCIN